MTAAAQAPRFTITYTDGTIETVVRRPIHLVKVERMYPEGAGQNELLMCWLWAASTGGSGKVADFEAWLDTVEEWAPAAQVATEDDAAPLSDTSGSPV